MTLPVVQGPGAARRSGGRGAPAAGRSIGKQKHIPGGGARPGRPVPSPALPGHGSLPPSPHRVNIGRSPVVPPGRAAPTMECPGLELVLLIVLLALSALFSGSETAFFSLSAAEVAQLEATGGRRGRRAAALVRPHQRPAVGAADRQPPGQHRGGRGGHRALPGLFGPQGVAIAIPAVTLLLLLFGEITPKLAGARATRAGGPGGAVAAAGLGGWRPRPVLWLTGTLVGAVLRLLPADRTGWRPLAHRGTADRLRPGGRGRHADRDRGPLAGPPAAAVGPGGAADHGAAAGGRGAARGHDRDEVLRRGPPRGLQPLSRASRPRAPIRSACSTSRTCWRRPGRDLPLAGGGRPLLFVPESKDVDDLLAQMRSGGSHMAAVVDEHGDFTGIVTLADCLQALIGPGGRRGRRATPT